VYDREIDHRACILTLHTIIIIAAHFLARDKGFCWVFLPRMLWGDWRRGVRINLGHNFLLGAKLTTSDDDDDDPKTFLKNLKKSCHQPCAHDVLPPLVRFEIAPSFRPSVHPLYLGSFDTNYIIILKILEFSAPKKKHSKSKILCRKIQNNILHFLQYSIFNMQSSN